MDSIVYKRGKKIKRKTKEGSIKEKEWMERVFLQLNQAHKSLQSKIFVKQLLFKLKTRFYKLQQTETAVTELGKINFCSTLKF